MTKPVGDACRDDGTLKDASEMVWPDSPTELEAHRNDVREPYESYDDIYASGDGQTIQNESDHDPNDLSSNKVTQVSCVLQIWYGYSPATQQKKSTQLHRFDTGNSSEFEVLESEDEKIIPQKRSKVSMRVDVSSIKCVLTICLAK